MKATTVLLFAGLLIAACSGPAQKPASDPAQKSASDAAQKPATHVALGPAPAVQRTPMAALPDIDIDAVLAHIKILSSDEFEGRGPGTRGEERTVEYLIDQFKKIGAKPGNTDGTYIEKVPLVGITATPAPLGVRKGSA